MTQWQVPKSNEKRNTNGNGASSFRNLENRIKSVLDHEEKIIREAFKKPQKSVTNVTLALALKVCQKTILIFMP